jgi:putative sigma-54 modulation protein
MRLELTGRHVDITPPLRRLLDTKLSKLERLLNGRAVSAQAVLTREKHRHRAEVTLHAKGEKFLHGVGDGTSWEASLTQAFARLTQQAQRMKGKFQERKRRGAGKGIPIAGESRREAVPARPAVPVKPARERVRKPRILRATRQPVKPMSVADAAREIEAGGDGVVVFRDLETAAVSVLYRRTDGELTLVETEA